MKKPNAQHFTSIIINTMKHYLILITFCWLLIIATTTTQAQQPALPEFITSQLDEYVLQGIKDWNLPGVAVAIVKDGRVLVAKGYGLRDHHLPDPVDANTLFMIASNTKSFTGTAVALLEYQDKCKITDKVTGYVPGFAMNDPWVTQHVTIADVLSHRIGMATFQGDFLYFYSNLKPEEIYEKFPLIVPQFDFRERYGYCNAGYFWAGQCIESITGKPWNEFIETQLLQPLEMNRTLTLSENLQQQKNVASAHTLQQGVLTVFPQTNIDVIGPAASMSSSVNDLSHWLIAQLDSGRYNGRQVIPYEVIAKTRYPQTIQSRNSMYGLGWSIEDYADVQVISHGGGILGFVTGVTIVPELNLGIVVLTNSDENWFYDALKDEILDAFLGKPVGNYSGRYLQVYNQRQAINNQQIQQWRDTVLMHLPASLPLAAFAGKYESELYGSIRLSVADESLLIDFEHHPDLKATLQHLSGDRFLCTYFPSRMGTEVFPFIVKGGEVQGFTLKVADRLERTSYNFIKVGGR
ncbi:MAG: serine hydrolase [Clostridia bacterium]|nr:serine hydrolase [Clostridia bacterium]